MKNKDLYALHVALNKMGKLTGVKFAYGVSRNLSILAPLVESFDKAKEPTAEFVEYEKARIELAKEYADKDEKGNPKIEISPADPSVTQYAMTEKEEEFGTAWNALKVKYAEAIEAREKQAKEFNELMELENPTVDLHKVKLADIPANISVQEMYSLQPIIEE